MNYRVKMILPVVGMFLLGCVVLAAVRDEGRGIKHPFPESSAPLTAFAGGTFDRRLKPEGVTRVSSAGRDFTFIVFDTSGYAATD